MIAFDTSLIVRVATGDSPKQKRKALALLESDQVLVPKSVILETEWVLRSRYKLTAQEIAKFLLFLVESQGILIEDTDSVRKALGYYEAGADFADAIHLASAGDTPLYTLDKAFCRQAIKKGVAPGVKIVAA